MLIVDYVRSTRRKRKGRKEDPQGRVYIPTYHRGHTGLLPGTPVTVALKGYGGELTKGVEVVITAFRQLRSAFALTVTLRDQAGVVQKLLESISRLRLNVLLQESASIQHQNLHVVNLLLDWGTSSLLKREPPPPRTRYRLNAFNEVIPQDDLRFLRLLNSILLYCEEDLHWDPSPLDPSREIPAIRIKRPYEDGHVIFEAPSKLEMYPQKNERKKTSSSVRDTTKTTPPRNPEAFIQLPDEIMSNVAHHTGHSLGEKIPYMVLSEANSRIVRVFFPSKEKSQRLLHCAFTHKDDIGALSAIANALGKSDFNLVTSLLRRAGKVRNTWEVYLEYCGSEALPEETTRLPGQKADRKAVLDFIQERLTLSSGSQSDFKRFDVKLGSPRHPAFRHEPSLRPLDQQSSTLPTVQGPDSRSSESEIRGRQSSRDWAFDFSGRGISLSPRIFFSYPHTATTHASEVKRQMSKHFDFEPDEFQDSNGQEITSTVISKICEADFFIAIWHPDADQPSEISPWLTFEFGIARAHNKSMILAVNEKIRQKVWKRIDPHVSRYLYSDLDFRSQTVQGIVNCVRESWGLNPPKVAASNSTPSDT